MVVWLAGELLLAYASRELLPSTLTTYAKRPGLPGALFLARTSCRPLTVVVVVVVEVVEVVEVVGVTGNRTQALLTTWLIETLDHLTT